MPTTIKHLIQEFDLPSIQKVSWKERIPTQDEGIYIVSLSDDPNSNNGILDTIPISKDIIEDWIEKVGGFEIDKIHTNDSEVIIERMSQFWLPDENIIYIGKAPKRKSGKGIGNRVNEYYRTEYGARKPHAGGHWIKALTVLDDLFVYYSPCDNPGDVETAMLRYFCESVSDSTREILRDKTLTLPFANLQLERGQIKNHGLGKMKL